ncbi:uncharacterized protein LOC133648983 [Entelurus aequoreus]|uniref:uncharacterized protein LOC133648983 n=1 Tax=Entelurus aequoreus TaxID=161455 RepID=UPI002B1E8E58|nr:uncharacterized protein LOC133648983 [Entelurus aequoreus]
MLRPEVFPDGLVFRLVLLFLCLSPSFPTTVTDKCLRTYGGLEIDWVRGDSKTYFFDLCSVIKCGGKNSLYRSSNLYLCDDIKLNHWCRKQTTYSSGWCPSWTSVTHYTGPSFYHYRLPLLLQVIQRGMTFQRNFDRSQNPLALTIIGMGVVPSPFYVVLGVEQAGTDPKGIIKINILERALTTFAPSVAPKVPLHLGDVTKALTSVYTNDITTEDLVALTLGAGAGNLWLRWMTSMAKSQNLGDCVACSAGRPFPHTYPAPFKLTDINGSNCLISLFSEPTPPGCDLLASVYPPVDNSTRLLPFVAQKLNYTCFQFKGPSSSPNKLGDINPSWCTTLIDGSRIGPWARADLFWYCGEHRLYIRIPKSSVGLCAMVRLVTPLTLVGTKLTPLVTPVSAASLTSRRRRHVLSRRSVKGSFDLMRNPDGVYFDAIGQPRGVPSQHKLWCESCAGFENLPIIGAIFPVTATKNVERINYVFYNLLRLTNLTRDAVEGLAEQLAPTSLMAIQNRIALDRILAKEEGVCAMFGDQCCTFIPNNTAPDGSVQRALEGLQALSKELTEVSGVSDPFKDWLQSTFGRWTDLIKSVLVSIGVFLAIIASCGCFIAPCAKSLCTRIIVRAVEGQPHPVSGLVMSLKGVKQNGDFRELLISFPDHDDIDVDSLHLSSM